MDVGCAFWTASSGALLPLISNSFFWLWPSVCIAAVPTSSSSLYPQQQWRMICLSPWLRLQCSQHEDLPWFIFTAFLLWTEPQLLCLSSQFPPHPYFPSVLPRSDGAPSGPDKSSHSAYRCVPAVWPHSSESCSLSLFPTLTMSPNHNSVACLKQGHVKWCQRPCCGPCIQQWLPLPESCCPVMEKYEVGLIFALDKSVLAVPHCLVIFLVLRKCLFDDLLQYFFWELKLSCLTCNSLLCLLFAALLGLVTVPEFSKISANSPQIVSTTSKNLTVNRSSPRWFKNM